MTSGQPLPLAFHEYHVEPDNTPVKAKELVVWCSGLFVGYAAENIAKGGKGKILTNGILSIPRVKHSHEDALFERNPLSYKAKFKKGRWVYGVIGTDKVFTAGHPTITDNHGWGGRIRPNQTCLVGFLTEDYAHDYEGNFSVFVPHNALYHYEW